MPTHYKGTDAEIRALNAHINLVRASDSLIASLGSSFESMGLTVAQFGVLEALHHLGPMCQKELGTKLLRSGGNITVVVDNLEKQRLVRRDRQADDRRWIRIHLTPKGHALIERVFPKHVDAVVKELSILDPEEQETLRRVCRKLGKGCSKHQTGDQKDAKASHGTARSKRKNQRTGHQRSDAGQFDETKGDSNDTDSTE